MARILFAWELGGALGHVAKLRPIAEELYRLGHEIHLVANGAVPSWAMSGIPVTSWPIPVEEPRHTRSSDVRTYADVLRNVGFGNPETLATRLRAWQSLLRQIEPRTIVANASPTPLLAARGWKIPTVVLGTGYDVPPASYPLPELRFWDRQPIEQLRDNEDAVVTTINKVLRTVGAPPLACLRDLFESTTSVLCTVKELDHYRDRTAASYIGNISRLPGDQVPWPIVDGPRVFAYLKPFPELPKLLEQLQRRQIPTLIYGPSLPSEMATHYGSRGLRFTQHAIDPTYIARTAALAITNAGHGLALEMLLAGVPLLCFPLFLEQYIVARNVEATGAGKICSPWGTDRIARVLDALLDAPSHTKAAKDFARRYAHLDPIAQSAALAAQIDALTA